MDYRNFHIFIWFDENTTKSFDVRAVDIESALADIREGYGAFSLYQWSVE